MLIDSNSAILSSAAIERLFSVGKDVLKPKGSGLTDQNFEMQVFLEGACNQAMSFNFLTPVATCLYFLTCFYYIFNLCFIFDVF